MDYPLDFVIAANGDVVRRDKAKARHVIPESYTFGDVTYPNTFREKEDAYACRDSIIDAFPTAFLDETPKTPKKPGPAPRNNVVDQDTFRDMMREDLMKRREEFWLEWGKLKAADKCDLYYKMLAYSYAKAPAEKVTDPAEAEARKADRKREAAAERISQGLDGISDTNFEE